MVRAGYEIVVERVEIVKLLWVKYTDFPSSSMEKLQEARQESRFVWVDLRQSKED